MKKIVILLSVLIFTGLLIIFNTCSVSEPRGIEVTGVYYNECTDDVYYWGEGVHVNKWIYLIGVNLSGKYSLDQFKKVNWKSLCIVEGNEITFSRNYNDIGILKSPNMVFSLRLKNTYDPTADINKCIFFSDKYFIITEYTGGEFGHTDESTGYLSTRSKVINFNYLNK